MSSSGKPVPEHLDTGRLVRLLRQIYATASERYTATGKFAYITALADDALETLGDRDRHLAEITGLSTEVAELAAGTGMPAWIAVQVAALRPVSQGEWQEPDGTRWHAEANQVSLIVTRISQCEIAYPYGQGQEAGS